MIKTTKIMLSKAWAICSAFKPEEALHNERLNKTILAEEARKNKPNFVLIEPDTFGILPTGTFRSMHMEIIFMDSHKQFKEVSEQKFISYLEADKDTGFGNEGGAK